MAGHNNILERQGFACWHDTRSSAYPYK